MNLSAPFINRPVATSLLAIGLALAGILAFYLLPVAALPEIEFPNIIVQASLPGASPEIMATSVASPIEKELTRIAGITDMTSSSKLGSTQISVQFDLSRDIDGAARDVQAAINASASSLPSNIPTRPTYRKLNPADAPILVLALTSDSVDIADLYDYASTQLQQQIMQVEGVGQVTLGGSSLPAMRVELNPSQLNQYGIGSKDVEQVIKAANTNVAKGLIDDGERSSIISMNDQLFDAKEYGSLIITSKNGNNLRISDIADVRRSVQDVRNAGLLDGKPTVALVIFKEAGANVIETVDRVLANLSDFMTILPASVRLEVVIDRTVTIRSSLRAVEQTLVTSVALVVLVVYLFLGSLRLTALPAIAMVLSLLGTFVVIEMLDFSLNNISLMALIIATGFVVDDAIVVMENISRHIEAGMKPKQAALKGAQEIGFTVLSMSISLIAVFIPILCMGGIVGRLFREFAVTLAVAIAVSLVVSLTITPTMCAYIIRSSDAKPKESRLKSFYARTLSAMLCHRHLMLGVTMATVLLSITLYIFIPKGFFPQQDTGRIISSVVADQNISFRALKEKVGQLAGIIEKDPCVKHVVSIVSGSASGIIYIALNDLASRHDSADMIINRLRGKLSHITGVTLYMQSAQDLTIGGRQGNAQFQYTLSADSIAEVNEYGKDITQALKKLPGIADVNSDQRDQALRAFVEVNYDNAARLGVNVHDVDDAIYLLFGQSLASTMYTDLNQYYVVLEAAQQYTEDPKILNYTYVKSVTGALVPLSSVAQLRYDSTLLAVNHQGLSPAATISFNLLPGTPLGNAVGMVDNVVKEMNLPLSVQSSFRGTAQAFQASLQSEPYLIAFALLVVYIVLGMLYESLIHPITIISTLPSAGVGALLALLATKTDLTIIALIGIILLVGIVKKNAIMMLDFTLTLQRNNMASRDAVYQAAILRFRPIMMTTMSAILGALPLVLNGGMGAEMHRPLGISIIGGLIFSQILTLYTVPAIYLMMEGAVGVLMKNYLTFIKNGGRDAR